VSDFFSDKALEHLKNIGQVGLVLIGLAAPILAALTKTGRGVVRWLGRRIGLVPREVVFVPSANESYWYGPGHTPVGREPSASLYVNLMATNTTDKPVRFVRCEIVGLDHQPACPQVEQAGLFAAAAIEPGQAREVRVASGAVPMTKMEAGQSYVAEVVLTDNMGRKHRIRQHRFRHGGG
jgi:hypothetical protein